jgi:hypothetical protein
MCGICGMAGRADETLAQAFEVWLLCARDSCREKAKNPIGRRDFEQWKRFRLLAAFDLMYWGKLNGYKYKDPFLANTLRPNEPWVDLTERFRKVTKPLVEFEQSLKALGIVSSRKSECNSSESIPE